MLKKFRLVAIVLLICLMFSTLSGCWDAQDLEDLSIPIAVAYDTSATGPSYPVGNIEITTLMPVVDPEVKSKFKVEEVTGIEVGYTRNQRAYISTKTFIIGMVQVAIFGEEAAAAGLNPIADTIYRSPQTPNAVMLAVAEGKANEVLKTPIEDSANIGVYLKDLLRKGQQKAFVLTTNLHELIKESATIGDNPVLPLIKIENQKVVIAGSAIFKKDKLIGKVDTQDTVALVMLRGAKCRGYIPFVIMKDGQIADKGTVMVTNKRKVKVERQGDDFTFQVTITLAGHLVGHTSKILFTDDQEMLKVIEDKVASDTKRNCEKFINKMQEEFQVDCIGLTSYALAKWRNELQDKVDEGFIENTHINVDVEVKLDNIGEAN